MDKNDLTLLFAYNRWANGKIMEASRWITPEQLVTPAQVSFGSLMGTLVHILGAEINWRLRLQEGKSPTGMVSVEEYPTLEDLTARWQAEETAMQGFIESLRPEDVNRWVEFTTTSGKPQGATVWRALAHLVNHGTQFRSEAAVVLTNFGRSPGDLDMLLYMRESDQR